jgi:hypothetical protein
MALLLAACAPMVAPGQPAPAIETPSPVPPTETPAPSPTPALTPAEQAAVKLLAQLLGIAEDQIKVSLTEAAQWDGCYGIGYPHVACVAMLTDGFKVVLEANGHLYQFHTNQDGSEVYWAAWEQLSPEGAAVKALIDRLILTVPEVKIVKVESVEWPDSCLGISRPDARCAQAITPGYRITLEANGKQYEFHTNADGSAVVEALVTLKWDRQGGLAGFCDTLTVATDGTASFGKCNELEAQAQLTADELAQLNAWARQFSGLVIEDRPAPGTADGLTILLTMSGLGNAQPTEAEQQAIAEWAQTVYTRLTTK